MSQYFQGPFGLLVLTFCAPSVPHKILRAIGPRVHLILTPADLDQQEAMQTQSGFWDSTWIQNCTLMQGAQYKFILASMSYLG